MKVQAEFQEAERKSNRSFLITMLAVGFWLFWLFCCGLAAYMLGQFMRDYGWNGWWEDKLLFLGVVFAFVSGCYAVKKFVLKE